MRLVLRRGAFALLPALALVTSLPSQATPGRGLEKLDGHLRGLTLRAAATPTQLVPLYIKTTDPALTTTHVRALGGTVGTLAGDILTARVPASAVSALAAADHVARLEGAIQVHRKLDKVRAAMHVDEVQAGNKGTPALKGAGVIVGVIDYGLDLDHKAFKKADGSTRVIGLWDQAQKTGTPPTGYTYGAECTATVLTAGTCAHDWTEDHGTHVTGIAAGSAVGSGTYTGIAPEAEIAFVNLGGTPPGATSADDATSTAICDGAAYLFGLATAVGKPVVINMSLGAHFGPHDGSSLADQCLDNLTGPGKIIVAAAGNEGDGSTTASTNATSMNVKTFVHMQLVPTTSAQAVRFLPSQHSDGSVDLDGSIWFDDPTVATIRIGAVVPGSAPRFTTVASPTVAVPATLLMPPGAPVANTTYGPVTIAGSTSATGQHSIAWHIADANADKGELNDVQWILEITGTAADIATSKVDGYIDTTDRGGFITNAAAPGASVDSNQTIGYPAIAKSVLAIGSYVSRNAWTPLDNTLGMQTQTDSAGQQVVLGNLSGFSSHGPPRTTTVVTAPKPDITAPGELVASALNSKSTPDPKRILVASPNGYVLIEGTSMASPAAAGVVALMLEKTPTLTVDQIRTNWKASADAPSGVTLPSAAWGVGKLDALTALGGSESFDAGAPEAGSSTSSSSSSGDTTSSSSSSTTGGLPSSTSSTSSTTSSGNAAASSGSGGGGGGCATSSGTASGVGGASAVLVGIALLFSRRRRRA